METTGYAVLALSYILFSYVLAVRLARRTMETIRFRILVTMAAALAAVSSVFFLAYYVQHRNISQEAFYTVLLGVDIAVLYDIWKHWWRKRKNRASALIGAKSRALRDKLVQRVRELKPRPAPVPVPVRFASPSRGW